MLQKMPMWVEGKAGRKEIKDAVWAAVGLKRVRDGDDAEDPVVSPMVRKSSNSSKK